MRYGKKLALLTENAALKGIERPIISHRNLKEILSNISRSLKFQTDLEALPELVRAFCSTIETDLVRIIEFIQLEESSFSVKIEELEQGASSLGIVGSGVLGDIIGSMENAFVSPCITLHQCIGEHMKDIWISLTMEVASFAEKFNAVSISLHSLFSYADLNVAGFRKLLKQYGKQVPNAYRLNAVGIEQYRRIVTGLLPLVERLESLRQRTEAIMQRLSPGVPPLHELKVGTETAIALEEPTCAKLNERSVASTAPASPSLRNIPDFAPLVAGGSTNLNCLQSKLFEL